MIVREPKYHTVMEQLADFIADAEPGTPLETERELATRFATSRTTVRQALSALAAEGRVERTQGSGTFVAEPKRVFVHQLTSYSEDLRAQGRNPASIWVSVDRVTPTREVRTALALDGSAKVHRVERVRLVDGEPLAAEVAHLAGSLPRLRQEIDKRGSLYQTLREAYGVSFARAEDIVETGLASPREAALLGVDVGAPMLVVHRTAYDTDDRPVEYTRSVFRGDRFRFVARSSI
ncbi:HTH-type transcriptional repressor dasR [Nostocoides japonicum T1-X7]|uniref:HTH-type transcriptional repressor dasR n=1 Tax=Nostocoides japonicum T1-X7 TaxID=1194083 RepID=A0A077LSK6_9MICO|nr:HTH-type transcriptional repressor dasR [Tetrasphaera japonica T1-X7]